MKKNTFLKLIILLAALIAFTSQIHAQSSTLGAGIYFQAIARDNFSNPAIDRKVYVQASILQGSKFGVNTLTEEFFTTTDNIGIFGISVGLGKRIGGTASNIETIDWTKAPYFLNIKVSITPLSPSNNWDYNAEWVDLGTTPFGTVPYALYAISAPPSKTTLTLNDTAAMLLPYAKASNLRVIDSVLNALKNYSDTIRVLNTIVRTGTILDSNLMYADLLKKVNVADSNSVYITPYYFKSYLAKVNGVIKLDTAGFVPVAQIPVLNQNTTGNASTATSALYADSAKIALYADSASYAFNAKAASLTTKLATARNINGIPFDGTRDITIAVGTADAGTISGTTLSSNVINSSLTSLGTITTGVWSATTIDIAHGGTSASDASMARLNLGAEAILTFNLPISKGSNNSVYINKANSNEDGYLSKEDHIIFSNKIDETKIASINGVASLGVDGKVPSNQIGSISLQDVRVVATENDMLSLNHVVSGSVAIRSDIAKNFVLRDTPSTTLSNWIELASSSTISSVNGQAGNSITLTTDNITEGAANKYFTNTKSRLAISSLAPLVYNSTTGIFSLPKADLNGDGFLSKSDFAKFNSKIDGINRGAINGVASLDSSGKIPLNQIPTLNQNTTGTASIANKLSTARNINGVPFDGTSDITIDVAVGSIDAGTITGTTLASSISNSSLTSVGIINSGTWSGSVIDVTHGGTGANGAPMARLNLGAEAVLNFMGPLTRKTGDSVGIYKATSSTDGYLSKEDFNSFAKKISDSIIGKPSGVASLDLDGKVPSNQIPAISFQSATVVKDLPAMLALSGQVVGSIAILADSNKNYVLSKLPSDSLSNWLRLASGGVNGVISVNGIASKNLYLTTTDIPEGIKKFYSDSLARASLLSTAPLTYNASTGMFSITKADATGDGYLSKSDYTKFNNKIDSISRGALNGVASLDSLGKVPISQIPILNQNTTGNATTATTATTAINAGTATTATKLATARNINGVPFDGTADITIAVGSADAGTISGTTLASNIVTSSLTGVSTITTGVWSASTIDVAHGGTGATTLTGILLGNGKGAVTTAVAGVDYLMPGGNVATATNAIYADTARTATTATNAGTATTATKLATARNINGVPFDGTVDITIAVGSADAGTISGTTLASNIVTSSLTGVSTITTGVWSASTIDVAHGGTGATTLAGILLGNGKGAVTTAVAGVDYLMPGGNVATATNATYADTARTATIATSAGTSSTATKLATARNINGVPFDGTADITIAVGSANAGTISGTTLASNIVSSSLTSVGTIETGVWSGTTINVAHGGTGTTTLTGILLGNGKSPVTQAFAGTDYLAPDAFGNAAIATLATKLQTARKINGVDFDGSSNITISADAGTITGTSLPSNLTTSYLTSVGTIKQGVWSGTTIDVAHGGTGVTTLTGIVKGNGLGAFSQAVAGTDYLLPTGTAAEATKLATVRNINGVPFDGTGDISIVLDAGTITGTTLPSNVVSSSLTTVGTINSGTWSASTIDVLHGGTGAKDAANARLNLGAESALTFTSPLSRTSNTIDIPKAASGIDGYLSKEDWKIFNDKIDGSKSGVANGFASLDSNRKIPSDQIPSISFQSANVVLTKADMIALPNQVVGSIAVVSSINKNYVLSVLPSSDSTNWLELASSGAIYAVNTHTGNSVNLTTDDISDNNQSHKYYTDQSARASVSVLGPLVYNTSSGVFSITKADSTTDGYLSKDDYNKLYNRLDNKIGQPNGVASLDGNAKILLAQLPSVLTQSTTGNAATATTATLAATATKLATARTINGVPFDGSSNITISTDAGNITGTTLPSNLTSSSLTSVGTITTGTWNGTTIDVANGGTGKNTLDGILKGNGINPVSTAIEGTDYLSSTLGNAVSASKLVTPRNINGVPFDGTDNIAISVPSNKITGTTLPDSISFSKLTKVGNLTSGSWQADLIDVAHGGTGADKYQNALFNLNAIPLEFISTNASLNSDFSKQTAALQWSLAGGREYYNIPTEGAVKAYVDTLFKSGNVFITNKSITNLKIADGTITSANLATNIVGLSNLTATGTPTATTYLRGDNTWATIASGGSVTSVTVNAGNGFTATTTSATTTPQISLGTSISGMLKGASGALTLATQGTDYIPGVVGAQTNNVPKFTVAKTLVGSQIYDNGTTVGIGISSPDATKKLDVNGHIVASAVAGVPSNITATGNLSATNYSFNNSGGFLPIGNATTYSPIPTRRERLVKGASVTVDNLIFQVPSGSTTNNLNIAVTAGTTAPIRIDVSVLYSTAYSGGPVVGTQYTNGQYVTTTFAPLVNNGLIFNSTGDNAFYTIHETYYDRWYRVNLIVGMSDVNGNLVIIERLY